MTAKLSREKGARFERLIAHMLCELGYDARRTAQYCGNTGDAADVRPVVLCRDCKHRDPEDHKCDCGQLERAGCVFPVDDDYYCAYGVKREES